MMNCLHYFLFFMMIFLGLRPLEAEPEKLEKIDALRSSLYQDVNLPTTGDPHSKTVIVEFFDYACPHCRAMYPPIHEVTRCDPHVYVVYRHLPLLGIDSKMKAKASLAAHKQGKFEDIHTWFMTKGYEADRSKILQHISSLGMNVEQFIKDWDGDELEKVFDHTIELALKLNVRSVPAVLVGDYISRESMNQKEFMDLLHKVHKENGTAESKSCSII